MTWTRTVNYPNWRKTIGTFLLILLWKTEIHVAVKVLLSIVLLPLFFYTSVSTSGSSHGFNGLGFSSSSGHSMTHYMHGLGNLNAGSGADRTENADVRSYGTTADFGVMIQARKWIENCCSSHSSCRPPSGDPFTPTRLVYVGQDGPPRLVEMRNLPAARSTPPQYLALSHCWGGDVKCKLTRKAYNAMKSGIDFRRLPQTFGDAIRLTRALGYQYIWIDSLCIIQDDQDDWAQESVLMIKVYAHARCTLSATASRTSHGGCIRGRWILVQESFLNPFHWQRWHNPDTLSSLFQTRVESAPLTKRAWVFQERLLSRRILHFCKDTVLFECNTLQASEVNPEGATYEKTPYVLVNGRIRLEPMLNPPYPRSRHWTTQRWQPVDETLLADQETSTSSSSTNANMNGTMEDHTPTRGIRGALDTLRSVVVDDEMTLWQKLEFNQRWYDLVSYYSQGALTMPSDKLIAIAGVAGIVEESAQAAYAAGLWTNVAFEFGLLWQEVEPNWDQFLSVAWSWLWSTVRDYTVGRTRRPHTIPSGPWFWKRRYWDYIMPSWPSSLRGTRNRYSYCAPSWSWASINGRIQLMPEVSSSNLSPRAIFHARVDQILVKLDGEVVKKAASHLDDGYIDISGPVADVLRTRRNEITFRLPGSGPKKVAVQYAPDPYRGGQVEGMIAILILSMNAADWWDKVFTYGLVLRPRTGNSSVGEFERVGIFKAASMEESIKAPLWVERRVRVF